MREGQTDEGRKDDTGRVERDGAGNLQTATESKIDDSAQDAIRCKMDELVVESDEAGQQTRASTVRNL